MLTNCKFNSCDMMTRAAIKILLSLLPLLLVCFVQAEQINLLSANTPIFSEFKDDGTVEGYSIDFAQAILKSAGFHSTVTPLPFARVMQDIHKQKNTVATGIGRTRQRENDFYWLAPITANVVAVYSPQPIDINELTANKKTVSVAVMRGDYRSKLGKEYDAFNVVEFNTWEQALGSVLKGRVDGIFFSEMGIALTCYRANMDCSSLQKQYTHNVQYSYMVIPKNNQNKALASKISKAAREFVTTPEYQKLVEKWLPKLQLFSSNVNNIEGVITLGKFDEQLESESAPWVLAYPDALFTEVDSRGKLSGYAVELVEHILGNVKLNTKILIAPWQRIFVESAMKPNVLVFSLARTLEREEQFHWITPITRNAYSVFKMNNNTVSAINLSSLPAKSKIAVLKGDFREQLIEDANHVPVVAKDWNGALRHFINGNADYLFFSDAGLSFTCDAAALDCSSIDHLFTYETATTYLALSKNNSNQSLLIKLRNAADEFKQTTEFQSLVDRWLETYTQKTVVSMKEENGIILLGNGK